MSFYIEIMFYEDHVLGGLLQFLHCVIIEPYSLSYGRVGYFTLLYFKIVLKNAKLISIMTQVKDGGKGVKSAYKGLRSKLKENQNTTLEDNKHRSAPSSPTSGKRRTLASAFGAPVASYRKDAALTFKNSQMQRLVLGIKSFTKITCM